MTSYTPNLDLAKQDTGAQGWGTVLNQNFDKIDAGFGAVGVKVYSATITYASGEFVIASVSGVIGLYKSLQGNNVGHALTDTTWWEVVPLSGSADVDGKSITKNSLDELQTIGVINQNDTTTAIKTWTGTKAQYDAIVTKDANTLYNVTDDTDVSLTILEALYPVGSIYITTNATCPLSTLIAGSTWVQETSRILVDKGSSGTDWWELYSDGWCEQGGTETFTNYKDVSLLKSYASISYMGYAQEMGRFDSAERNTKFLVQSASTLRIVSGLSGQSTTCCWKACGYTSTTTTHKRFRRTA